MTRLSLLRAFALIGGSALLLSGCNDDNDQPFGSSGSTTNVVLNLASTTSEDAEPFPVNDGAFRFDDTAEATDPTPINR